MSDIDPDGAAAQKGLQVGDVILEAGGHAVNQPADVSAASTARIFGDGKRQCTRAFTELVSHYLFQERFGRPGKGEMTHHLLEFRVFRRIWL
jgi:hypothetical protein